MSPEYTGPPIGDPPQHVHEDTPAVEAVEDAVADIDEQIVQLLEKTEANNTEVLRGVTECQNRLEVLLTQRQTELQSENPLLTEILSQLREIQAQLVNLKSSMDSRQSPPVQNGSEVVTEVSVEPNPENLMEEVPDGNVENNQEPPKKKRRFI